MTSDLPATAAKSSPMTRCFLILSLAAAGCQGTPPPSFRYPESPKIGQVDVYHNTKVADPYRWLEDPDSAQTRQWIQAQNKITSAYLESVPLRQSIHQRLTELWNYEKYGVPFKKGSRYFFSKNDGLQNQSVVYTLDKLDSQPRILIDPNTFSTDGTVALTNYKVSENGQWVAYGLSSGGSDWQEWRVRNVQTGQDLKDQLKWIKFSTPAWTHDQKGFFYSRFDEPKNGETLEEVNYYHKLYYHRLGTAQAEDTLIYQRPDQKEWGFGASVSEDGRYLIIQVRKGTDTRNRVFYKDLQDDPDRTIELLNDFDASYQFIGNEGPVFWFLTNLDAPRYRLLAVDTNHPARRHWREVILQSSETLQAVKVIHNRFLASYLKDAHAQIKLYDLEGRFLRELKLPGLGSVSGLTGERKDRETFYAFSGFTFAKTIYRYDLETSQSTIFRRPEADFKPEDYKTRQVFYRSRDGVEVPMFITHKKRLKLNGNNPTLLYGYGGFNIPITPSFSVANLVWMEMGGVYAVANIRGGGEYGEAWHQAGMKLKKQTVFDDFLAAAEWLIANRYTSASKLAITGRSNGGLLVGACLTQRPELFKAAVPAVGVLDMLRFHKFTIGWAWTSDYGSPDDPEEFKALYAYSPYHNVKAGTRYPATLITTADHDDRVVPAHSFKFAAALQASQAGLEPILIRVDTRAGHGSGKPTSKKIETATDVLSFLVRELGVEGQSAFLTVGGRKAAGRLPPRSGRTQRFGPTIGSPRL